MRRWLLYLSLLPWAVVLTGCGGPVRKTEYGFHAEGALSRFDVVCYAPDIIQVVKSPLYGRVDPTPSASVVLRPRKVRFDFRVDAGGRPCLETDSLRVELDLAAGVFSFFRSDGTLLVREQQEAVSHEEIHQGFLLEDGEAVYGLGPHPGNGLDQRGKQYHLEKTDTDSAVPLVHSVKGYAVYWDNYSPTAFRSEEDWISFSSMAGKNCSYFFLGGGNADAVIRNIRLLTGTAPMPPLPSFDGREDCRAGDYTRGAAAGIQREGVRVWSGDLSSGWTSLRDQAASALNLSLCGIPYTYSDIGGSPDPDLRQLYGRWMQLAVFTGVTLVPGAVFPSWERDEAGSDGPEAAVRLRRLLLPYLYTQAWKVTSEGASLLRPLFADWPDDRTTWRLGDEFLLGNALLVAPVLQEDDTRHVYLPEGRWQDFWDGRRINGGVSFDRSEPRDRIPVYVKAGTILPAGPEGTEASECPWDDIQLRIYGGADGDFLLYEDEGDGHACGKGAYSEIPMHWDDAAAVLTIGSRRGGYPGMPAERTFRIVIVRPDAGTGLDRSACDVAVTYCGREIRADMN